MSLGGKFLGSSKGKTSTDEQVNEGKYGKLSLIKTGVTEVKLGFMVTE
jgi:hypothetical protein